MLIKFARLLLVSLLVVCVPAQAALALSAGQCMALQHHADDGGHAGHAGHADDGHSHSGTEHDKKAESHCGPCAGCCASAAIAGVIRPLTASPVHDTVHVVPAFPPLAEIPSGLDRPPRSL